MRRVIGAALTVAVVATMAAACSSDDPTGPAEASCDTGQLSAAEDNRLAVLLSTDEAGRATLFGVDVRSGDYEVRCELPAEWKPRNAVALTMNYLGASFLQRRANDVLFGSQFISPGYRWAGGPGQPLIDVQAGSVVTDRPPGEIVAVTDDRALVTRIEANRALWCTAPLPYDGRTCDPLPDPGPVSGYVFGVDGEPTALSTNSQLLNLDKATIYVLTDGIRIYRAEWFPPGTNLVDPEVPGGTPPFQVAVPAEGNAVTAYSKLGAPPPVRLFDWFTPTVKEANLIRTDGHGSNRDEKQLGERLPDNPTTHYVLGVGDHMVIGQAKEGRTDFTMIYSGSTDIRGIDDVECPTTDCRILYWPNVIP